MKSKCRIFDNTFHQEIYQGMVDAQEHRELTGILVRMQTEAGISRDEAIENAKLCISAVISCESIRMEITDNAPEILDSLLEDVAGSDQRDLILHKMYFGLTVHRDPAALEMLEKGMSEEELFWRYYSENKDGMTAEELEQGIRSAMSGYDLSPEVLEALGKKLEASGDYLATSAALGSGGISFKSIAAMELYLKNRDSMSIHEAANIACASVEAQAAADAVGKGMLTRSAAKKILIIAGITLVVVGIAIAAFYSGNVSALGKAAAVLQDQYMVLPQVFADFATTISPAGDPLLLTQSADFVKNTVFLPAIQAAKRKELIGGLVMVLGGATAALSQKTADLLGRFRVGFTDRKQNIKKGLTVPAESAPQKSPLYHWDLPQQTAEETQTQSVPTGAI